MIADDVLLGVYALFIWRATRGEPTLAESRFEERRGWPRRDLLAIAGTYLVTMSFTFWFWFGGGVAVERSIIAALSAIPEEFAFRGVILSRLAQLLGNPQHALVLSSVLFVSSHAAATLAQGPRRPWWVLIPLLIAGGQPTGIAWGYLCHRTRSLWPGAIWHTTGTVLGPIFV